MLNYSQLADETIWQAFLEGDLDAYAYLYSKHSPKLILFSCKMTGDMESAKDLVQDVFRKLLEDKSTKIVDFEGWVKNAIRFRFISDRKKYQRRAKKLQEYKLRLPVSVETPNGIDEQKLEKFVRKNLSVEEFRILELISQGYPNQDIASEIGMRASAFRKKKYYILTKIRKLLTKSKS